MLFSMCLETKKAKAKCKGDYRDLRKMAENKEIQKINNYFSRNFKIKGVPSPHFNPEAIMLVVDTKSNLYLLGKCQFLRSSTIILTANNQCVTRTRTEDIQRSEKCCFGLKSVKYLSIASICPGNR